MTESPTLTIEIRDRPGEHKEQYLRAAIAVWAKQEGYVFVKEVIGTDRDDRVIVYGRAK